MRSRARFACRGKPGFDRGPADRTRNGRKFALTPKLKRGNKRLDTGLKRKLEAGTKSNLPFHTSAIQKIMSYKTVS